MLSVLVLFLIICVLYIIIIIKCYKLESRVDYLTSYINSILEDKIL